MMLENPMLLGVSYVLRINLPLTLFGRTEYSVLQSPDVHAKITIPPKYNPCTSAPMKDKIDYPPQFHSSKAMYYLGNMYHVKRLHGRSTVPYGVQDAVRLFQSSTVHFLVEEGHQPQFYPRGLTGVTKYQENSEAMVKTPVLTKV
jgi:hypothetical protein